MGLQMTTVLDKNVHNVAVDGNFDNCQDIVKALFKEQENDSAFKDSVRLGAVNSINWARILAQIVYYFSGYYQWLAQDKTREFGDEVSFVVPTGNFGNALAGYYAKQLGLPIKKIVVATNANDILHRFIENDDYTKRQCVATSAPAMDITVPSNFERYLYDLCGKNGATMQRWMQEVSTTGTFDLSFGGDKAKRLTELREIFVSFRADDQEIAAVQKDHFERFQMAHCPHTAVGIHAAQLLKKAKPDSGELICMATAHHGKFGVALQEAEKMEPALPKQLKELQGQPTRLMTCPNDKQQVKKLLCECVVGTGTGTGSTAQSSGVSIQNTAVVVVAAAIGALAGLAFMRCVLCAKK